MPLTDEQLEAIRGALGEDGAETFTAISEAVTTARTEMDSLKGNTTKAQREAAAKAKALEKALKDLESASGEKDERTAALMAERDAAQRALEEAAQGHRSYRMRVALAEKLGIADATKRRDALALFQLPETADIDDSGNLTGVDEAVKAFRESRGYLFEEGTAGGFGGGPKGGNPPPARGGKRGEPSEADKVADWTKRLFGERKQSA